MAKKQREGQPPRSSINSRYSADPCRIVGDREDEPDGPPPAPPIYNGDVPQKGQRLPVDEDDYLQPKSSNPAAYMDLVGGLSPLCFIRVQTRIFEIYARLMSLMMWKISLRRIP